MGTTNNDNSGSLLACTIAGYDGIQPSLVHPCVFCCDMSDSVEHVLIVPFFVTQMLSAFIKLEKWILQSFGILLV